MIDPAAATDPHEHDCPACCALPCECADDDETPETAQDREDEAAEDAADWDEIRYYRDGGDQ